MNQGQAVFSAVSEVFDVRPVPSTTEWTDKQKEQVYSTILQLFQSGQTSHKGNPSTEQLKKYIPGLVNNWVRKDKRLNGGVKYETKRPGSRTGSGDEQLKNMRALLSTLSDENHKQLVQEAIDKRVASLKPKVEVDINNLPESLRHLVK